MFIPIWLMVLIFAAAAAYWVQSRRSHEHHGRTGQRFQPWHDPDSPQHPLAYSAAYPVFSEHEVRTANVFAIEASRDAAEREADCLSRADFKECCASSQFTDAVRRAMLDVCEAIDEAERAWFRHAVMMHANLSAVSGRVIREDALAEAEARLKVIPSFGNEAARFREQWEANLIARQVKDPEPFTYSTPWYRRTRGLYYHPKTLWWKKEEGATPRLDDPE